MTLGPRAAAPTEIHQLLLLFVLQVVAVSMESPQSSQAVVEGSSTLPTLLLTCRQALAWAALS